MAALSWNRREPRLPFVRLTDDATIAKAVTTDNAIKIVSWNVNGLRACIKNGFVDWVKALNKQTSNAGASTPPSSEHAPDILCLQDIKATPDQLGDISVVLTTAPNNYKLIWSKPNTCEKKGYAGTAVFIKKSLAPISVTQGMGVEEHDREGRIITIELAQFYVVCCYVPNSGRALERHPYRTQKWDLAMTEYLNQLQGKSGGSGGGGGSGGSGGGGAGKSVIWCGDLNVAHAEIDLHSPATNRKSCGFTKEERANFTHLLHTTEMVDTFRQLYPKSEGWSYWSYRRDGRGQDMGWRLDYFVISQALVSRVVDCWVGSEIRESDSKRRSDHAPLWLVIRTGGDATPTSTASGDAKQ